MSDTELEAALAYCLTEEARAEARACASRSRARVEEIRRDFLESLSRPGRARRLPADHELVTIKPPGVSSAVAVPSWAGEGKRITKAVARRMIPSPARRWLRARIRRPYGGGIPDGPVFAEPRRLEPVSRSWGYDRGLPIDRLYIENFLGRHADDIRGRVLEVGDAGYTLRFGEGRVTRSDVVNPEPGNPATTIVADLGRDDPLPPGQFDCIILTQTLHLIYDVLAVIRNVHAALKPGGVLLATFPGITPISLREWGGSWYWMFTSNWARRAFDEGFPNGEVQVSAAGNVLTCSAFLYGLAAHELRREELEHRDLSYELIVMVRAVRGGES